MARGFLLPTPTAFKRSLEVATFLAGLTITALIFLLQVNERELLSSVYKETLILLTGVAATFLIMSVFAIKVVLVEGLAYKRTDDSFLVFFCAFAFYTYELGFSLLAILLPLLVYPFSDKVAYFIIAIEVLWAVIFVVHKVHKVRRLIKNS